MTEKKPEARPGALEMSHDASITWRYLAPAGVSLEMCQAPAFWSNCTRALGQQRVLGRHAWNRIEIIAEVGSWEADLRVLSVELGNQGAGGRVFTRLIREWREPAKPGRKAAAPQGYMVEHIPDNGWRVLDPKGGVIAEKLTLEDEALKAATAHAKKAPGKAA